LDKLRKIEDMETKEGLLLQKLQGTVKAKEDIKLKYLKVTGSLRNQDERAK
jgi:hypothetical protein